MKSIDLNKFPYLASPQTKLLFDTLISNDIEARFVGGCVREALLGHSAKDLDIAVNATPETVTNALENANIKVIPTGILHGTVTVVIGDQVFEITSLRADSETYGRHADVSFGASWHEDAQRRDFTINAIYLDINGMLFDPCNGQSDLEAGIVKFIGNAGQRIREDYLRILRFFRFHAKFGSNTFDEDAIAAIQSNLDGLRDISRERVRLEFMKTLVALYSLRSLAMMKVTGVADIILPRGLELAYYEELTNLELKIGLPPSLMRRLFIALPKPFDLKELARDLRLTKKEQYWLNYLHSSIHDSIYTQPVHYQLYYLGIELALDINLIATAVGYVNELDGILSAVGTWQKPTLPITGNDLRPLVSGKNIGLVLKSVESWWVENHFRPNYKDCLKYSKQALDNLK